MYIALELCPASLADVIESSSRADLQPLRQALSPVRVLYQTMAGLHHLHSLKIVHRYAFLGTNSPRYLSPAFKVPSEPAVDGACDG